jgi:hypothetical protein
MIRTRWREHRLMMAQSLGVLLGIAVLAVMPPVEGNTLLIPLRSDARRQVVAWAAGRGATLVQLGRFQGSIIVRGARWRLLPLLGRGVLVLQGGASGCRPA